MSTQVPFSFFDTRGLSPDRAAACWLDNIDVLFDVRLARNADPEFHARAGGFLFGDLIIGSSASRAQAFERSRYRAARDGLSHFLIQFYDAGRCGPRDGSAQDWTRPGDLLVIDLAQPLSTAATDFANLNLLAPRRLLAPMLQEADRQHMRIVRRESALVAVLESHLRSLSASGARMQAAQAQALARPTLEIVAAALNGGADPAAEGVRLAQKGEIRRWLRSRLDDETLTAEQVAARFGISRRKLYYLFEQEGGFRSYLQACRLQAVHAALIDPAHAGSTISAIAGAYGFRHRSALIAAFRRLYGLTPREARAIALGGRSATRPSPLHAQWRGWIGDIR